MSYPHTLLYVQCGYRYTYTIHRIRSANKVKAHTSTNIHYYCSAFSVSPSRYLSISRCVYILYIHFWPWPLLCVWARHEQTKAYLQAIHSSIECCNTPQRVYPVCDFERGKWEGGKSYDSGRISLSPSFCLSYRKYIYNFSYLFAIDMLYFYM